MNGVAIADASPDWTAAFVDSATRSAEDVAAILPLCETYGRSLPPPGGGQTAQRWAVLAAVAKANLTAARAFEAHTDALAILHEAGQPAPNGTWGVFAAESPNTRLDLEVGPSGLVATGVKPWCSLAADLDAALVTAHHDGHRQLVSVDLRHPTVSTHSPQRWVARGLRSITSASVEFAHTPVAPVGGPDWYLTRPGFAWGGMGVAACWHGGAVGLSSTLLRSSATRHGELADWHLGRVDAVLYGSLTTLIDAARRIDAGRADGDAGRLLAYRVRTVVANAAEQTLQQVGHALGPAPLAFDEDHAARVADLTLYLRQHHAERDEAALGAALRASPR